MNDVTEVLRRVRDLLAGHWTKKVLKAPAYTPDGDSAYDYCILGALYEVMGASEYSLRTQQVSEVEKFLAQRLREFSPHTHAGQDGSIMAWNDHVSRRHTHVLDFLDYAIKKSDDPLSV